MKTYYVYILASAYYGTLYIGVTSNLEKRLAEHRSGLHQCFTWKYKVFRLVYVEETYDVNAAIAREKQLKNWHRDWKINLIERGNPRWNDLYANACGAMDAETSSA